MDAERKKLEEQIEKLSTQNQLKSEWISIAAHQLRTSLSAIKWILKMFLDNDFGTLSSEQAVFMQKAFDSNERMLALVQEMLALNHTSEVTLHYEMKQNDLKHLVESTIFDFTSESFKKNIQLILLPPAGVIPHFAFDSEKIRVVIQNLIENAIKYSQAGDKIFVNVGSDKNEATLSVKDTGIGIPKHEQEKIFEKFFRATNAKSKEDVGSGLGLYTAKSIVEYHGGKLWFESEEGIGTHFHLTLPLHKAKPA
jgi:signal transduction histidine kinase